VPSALLLFFCLTEIYEGEILRMVVAQGYGTAQAGLDIVQQIALWLAAAYFAFSAVRIYVLDGMMAGAMGGSAPDLVRDVFALFILALAVTGIAHFVFGLEITAFWATSGAVGLVLGLALRPVILDVFSGLTISFDRSYRIGDWINLEEQRNESVSGEVFEITWRATRLRTVTGNLVVVPNSRMGMGIITNYSHPIPRYRQALTICLDFSIPVERARRVITGGVLSAIHPEGPLADPTPTISVEGTSDLGVVYRVDYWQVDYSGTIQPRSRVYSGVLRHLHAAGITPAYPKRDIFTAPLPADRLQALATGLVPRLFASGETVVRRGDAGESMFVLMEGLLEVRTELVQGDAEQAVAIIQPGEFLGEMSLLTGEPRMATVVAVTDVLAWEITKEQMEPVLRSDPAFATVLARTLAERQARNALARNQHLATSAQQTEKKAREILSRIVAVFRNVYDSLSRPPFLSGSRPPQPGNETGPTGTASRSV